MLNYIDCDGIVHIVFRVDGVHENILVIMISLDKMVSPCYIESLLLLLGVDQSGVFFT